MLASGAVVLLLAVAEGPRAVDFQAALRAGTLPRVSVNGTVTRLDSDRKLGDRVLSPATAANANVTASVPFSAQAWLAVARARDGLSAADAAREESRRTVARAVSTAYLGVVLRQELREVASRAVETASAHAALARARLEAGVASRLDVLRAEREVADNRARLASAAADVRQTQEVLGAVTGDGVALDAAGMPAFGALPPVEEALASLKSRPDVRAAAARLETAKREVEDRWADYLPQLAVQAAPFASVPATPTVPNFGWQAQLQLGWLAYDGGGIPARQAVAAARVRQAQAVVDALLLQSGADIRAAWAAVSQRADAEAETRVSVKLAQEAASLAKRQFEEGVAGNLELVDAERAARDAESAEATARAALVAAKLDCLLAAGLLARGE